MSRRGTETQKKQVVLRVSVSPCESAVLPEPVTTWRTRAREIPSAPSGSPRDPLSALAGSRLANPGSRLRGGCGRRPSGGAERVLRPTVRRLRNRGVNSVHGMAKSRLAHCLRTLAWLSQRDLIWRPHSARHGHRPELSGRGARTDASGAPAPPRTRGNHEDPHADAPARGVRTQRLPGLGQLSPEPRMPRRARAAPAHAQGTDGSR
jgi:hypothetical protein